MNITKDWLKEKSACSEGVEWFLAQKKTEVTDVIKALMKADKFDWANWTIVRVMERPQYIRYAIFAAECVIDIYEKQYPDDKRPRLAIEAAKEVLRLDNDQTRVAGDAAWAAAGAAGDAARAAWAAARAAWVAAGAAGDAAWAAARAAGDASRAAWAAARAAWAAAGEVAGDAAGEAAGDAAGAARDAARAAGDAALQRKIINYGLKLIKEQKCD